MGWNVNDFEEYEIDEFEIDETDSEPIDQPPSDSRANALLIGAAMGAVTLVVIAALIFTMVGHLFVPDETAQTSSRRQQPAPPSAADIQNANYRPSAWTEPNPLQFSTATPLPLTSDDTCAWAPAATTRPTARHMAVRRRRPAQVLARKN
jgi:hypothetical protein